MWEGPGRQTGFSPLRGTAALLQLQPIVPTGMEASHSPGAGAVRPLPPRLASHTYTALWKVPAACIFGPEGLFQNSGMLFCQQGCAEELIFPKSSLQLESDKDW